MQPLLSEMTPSPWSPASVQGSTIQNQAVETSNKLNLNKARTIEILNLTSEQDARIIIWGLYSTRWIGELWLYFKRPWPELFQMTTTLSAPPVVGQGIFFNQGIDCYWWSQVSQTWWESGAIEAEADGVNHILMTSQGFYQMPCVCFIQQHSIASSRHNFAPIWNCLRWRSSNCFRGFTAKSLFTWRNRDIIDRSLCTIPHWYLVSPDCLWIHATTEVR